MSGQISDLPRNPLLTFGGVRIIGRHTYGPVETFTSIPVTHQVPIKVKRDQDDLEKLRQLLGGLAKRPPQMMPNAGHSMPAMPGQR